MERADHFAEARRLLAQADDVGFGNISTSAIAAAQVHATLYVGEQLEVVAGILFARDGELGPLSEDLRRELLGTSKP